MTSFCHEWYNWINILIPSNDTCIYVWLLPKLKRITQTVLLYHTAKPEIYVNWKHMMQKVRCFIVCHTYIEMWYSSFCLTDSESEPHMLAPPHWSIFTMPLFTSCLHYYYCSPVKLLVFQKKNKKKIGGLYNCPLISKQIECKIPDVKMRITYNLNHPKYIIKPNLEHCYTKSHI